MDKQILYTPPKIVVLDGFTTNPGNLDWEPLRKLGDVTIHDRTPPNGVVKRAQNAEIVLTNKTPLTAQIIAQLPDLRFIGVLATGLMSLIWRRPASKASSFAMCPRMEPLRSRKQRSRYCWN